MKTTVLILIAALMAAVGVEALADPPDHAPAHGWRKKHDPEYVGYTGVKWERDYDVSSGRCDREAIGAVLGGATGAVVGSRIGDGSGRAVATIIGAVAGALLGAKVGRELDELDRACMGHALEVGASGHPVRWRNREGVQFEIIPNSGRRGAQGACRNFTLVTLSGSERASRSGLACQSEHGVWRIGAS
jgi:surface antigen